MSRISGLGDLRKKAEEDSKQNEFFAGGVDQRGGGSGLAVVGPPSSSRAPPGVFDNIVQRASNAQGNDADSFNFGPNSRQRIVTMYRNGFTVDDGPLRDLVSPESRAFLASLERGVAPRELVRDGEDVEVALKDMRSEDYQAPPPPAYVAFSGTAATVGSSAAAVGAAVFTESTLAGVTVPVVDESAPVTTLQVRTAAGKKVKVRLNHSATVLQLAAYIAREGGGAGPFALSAGFPPKDLEDGSATLAGAGLLGAAVIQRTV